MDDAAFFDAKAASSGRYKVYPDAEYARILAACGVSDEKRGARILDAGCGSGAFSEHLLRMGMKVTGMDVSGGLIGLAQAALPEGRFLTGDIFSTGFPDASFDAVFCGAVLHHFPFRLREAFREFGRILVPAGKVYYFEPYARSLNSFLWYKVLSLDRTPGEAALSPKRLEEDFRAEGFGKFSYARVDRVENVQTGSASSARNALNAARRFVSRNLLPNTYFAGSAQRS
jgi:ubiquinone/menaquinone biosynthesis C-methylase UbiE